MTVAEDQIEDSVEQLRSLQDAFARFTEQTAQLKAAYQELKRRAERMDTELEAANRQLERKVRELDEANNFQRSILDSIPAAVVVTDLKGLVRTFNKSAAELWGVDPEQAKGRDFRQILDPHHRLLQAVLEGREDRLSRRRAIEGPEGKVIASTACLVCDSAGRPIGAVQVDRDMTRLCSLQTELYQKGKLADLGKMAAGLAHEIRKPLNGIKGFASILQRKLDDDEARNERYVANIVGAADRLNGMLSRLLDFARPEDLHLDTCDLRREATTIAEFTRAALDGEEPTIAVQVPNEARWVSADADKIKQVLLNLVQNAVEALDGAGQVCITAECPDEEAGRAQVTVEDNGPGIPGDIAQNIMEPFCTTKEGGTGLGLSIVCRILELHETGLQVDSRPGRGTSMSFLLPLANCPENR